MSERSNSECSTSIDNGPWCTCYDLDDPDHVQVHPVGDLVAHTMDEECVCGPRAELIHGEDGDSWLIVHNSLDGREAHE